jgi:hypothetical protein
MQSKSALTAFPQTFCYEFTFQLDAAETAQAQRRATVGGSSKASLRANRLARPQDIAAQAALRVWAAEGLRVRGELGRSRLARERVEHRVDHAAFFGAEERGGDIDILGDRYPSWYVRSTS